MTRSPQKDDENAKSNPTVPCQPESDAAEEIETSPSKRHRAIIKTKEEKEREEKKDGHLILTSGRGYTGHVTLWLYSFPTLVAIESNSGVLSAIGGESQLFRRRRCLLDFDR
jgi:hypothetical protein